MTAQDDAKELIVDGIDSLRYLLNHAREKPRQQVGTIMASFTHKDNHTSRVDETLERLWEALKVQSAAQPAQDINGGLVEALKYALFAMELNATNQTRFKAKLKAKDAIESVTGNPWWLDLPNNSEDAIASLVQPAPMLKVYEALVASAYRHRVIKNEFLCGFCGCADGECEYLVSGPRVYICDVCVNLCVGFIDDARRKNTVAGLNKESAESFNNENLIKGSDDL